MTSEIILTDSNTAKEIATERKEAKRRAMIDKIKTAEVAIVYVWSEEAANVEVVSFGDVELMAALLLEGTKLMNKGLREIVEAIKDAPANTKQ